MNKLFTILMGMFLIITCSDKSPVGPSSEPELRGCAGSEIYDWSDLSFNRTLDQNDTLWLSFESDSLAIYTVSFDAVGYEGTIYDECNLENPEVGDTVLTAFTTTGLDELPLGIVPPDDYYLRLVNTRNRSEFNMTINIFGVTYGCMDNTALNYDENVNWQIEGACQYQDCNIDFYTEQYGDMILDCNGNCVPATWNDDGYCDDGAYCINNPEGECITVILWCEELEWDGGDCEVIIEDCPEGTIKDCNDNCAPEGWLGDGYCDDGTYEYNGIQIFFNCELHSNDNGDCNLGRTYQQRVLPNGRILIAK